jgi:hypothetical protein
MQKRNIEILVGSFVLLGFAQPALIPLGIADFLGAMWTWWELRKK